MWPELGMANCTVGLLTPEQQAAFSPADESVVYFSSKYVLSFYWALSTMSSLGYGQGPLATIVPFTCHCLVLPF